MMTAASTAAAADLFLAFMALDIHSFLDLQQQLGADLPAAQQAALLDSAVELLLPLAAMGILTTASAAIYRHLFAGAAGRNRRLGLGRLFSILCAAAATLQFFFFVLKPADVVVGDVGAQQARARALGLAAARVLPAAAAATFFVGMALVIVVVAHIRAGGEGGGGGRGGFAAEWDFQGAVSFLTKTAFAAAAGLIWLTALALCCGSSGIY